MTTLQEQRDYVRLHMDLDEDDLPDLLIDTWAREATTRVWKARRTWPFMEQVWELDCDGSTTYLLTDLATDADEITAIDGLKWKGPDDDVFKSTASASSGNAAFWTMWGGSIMLHPTPTDGTVLRVRGYAKPNDWTKASLEGAGELSFFPDEFDNTIRLWIISAAYMQQEDTELGITYADMFNDELTKFSKRYGVAPVAQPLVMGGDGVRKGNGLSGSALRWPWD